MQKQLIKDVSRKYKPIINAGKVSPYLLERKVIRIVRSEVEEKRFEAIQDRILGLSVGQLEYLVELPKGEMIKLIVSNTVPYKTKSYGRNKD